MVFLLATGLTSAYRIRFMLNVVWSPRQAPPAVIYQPAPNTLYILPILGLASITVAIGASLFWAIVTPINEAVLPLCLKLHALFAILAGITLGWALNFKIANIASWLIKLPLINDFLTSLAFTTPINAQITSRLPLFAGAHLQKNIEGGWVESLGGQGSISILSLASSKLSSSTRKTFATNLLIFSILAITLFILYWE